MEKTAEVGPRLTLNITDQERSTAKSVKQDFRIIIKKLEKSMKSITELRKIIVENHPSQEELEKKYRGRLLRYRRKIQDVFNDFLLSVKSALEKLSQISDPDMIRLQEIIGAEIGEMSSGAEAVLDLLKDTERDEFTKTLEKITAQMEKRERSIKDVIENQLFSHIDSDILGKLKISNMHFNIKRRARILRQLIRNK